MLRAASFSVESRRAAAGLRLDDQRLLHGLGRWPTYMLSMLTETPVLGDLAMKNVVTLFTGYLQ